MYIVALYRFDGRNLIEIDNPGYERQPYDSNSLRFPDAKDWLVTHVGFLQDGNLIRVEPLASGREVIAFSD